ncbi:hypothetical protein, conserved [Trypanosoma brucei gambiense DAL972]|uniref:Uncharacterized protein n=1 Tax=Trypanosoma brucei gambiense (strain MHOM/CI/86/DAL972) TaxID=679716 RepID=C9ZQZ8_TRYB9|nr:hypothetical protein, conserved [Trypanosoma brucei gambiense DAL972]CBH11828.1 hypothetical protein, conserved [Trypanosoma brucei gambiense DAL972]|eukprot:XP_011774113.1 hypothetical protein, conserved [Trypanosoma brucei gambiense DAL972]
MHFTSSRWITEQQRQREGLALRCAEEYPFWPHGVMGRESASLIMNTVFIEETDLFLFFTLRPLPVRRLAREEHWLFADCAWSSFNKNQAKFSHLENLLTTVNRVVRCSNAKDSAVGLQKSHSCKSAYSSFVTTGVTKRNRAFKLMFPSSVTEGRSAEVFWIGRNDIISHKLALFENAVWLPLNSTPVAPKCLYNADQVVMP